MMKRDVQRNSLYCNQDASTVGYPTPIYIGGVYLKKAQTGMFLYEDKGCPRSMVRELLLQDSDSL